MMSTKKQTTAIRYNFFITILLNKMNKHAMRAKITTKFNLNSTPIH